MGTTLYVALDGSVGDVEVNNDRVLLADVVADHESMRILCGKLKVPSLSEYQSYDPQLIAQFIDEPAAREAAIAKAPPIQWFNPADALQTVRALQDHYTHAGFVQERGRRRKIAGKVEWEPVDRTEDLLRELRDLEAVLTHAEKTGAKFRIYIGF